MVEYPMTSYLSGTCGSMMYCRTPSFPRPTTLKAGLMDREEGEEGEKLMAVEKATPAWELWTGKGAGWVTWW
jgi:hypothetical protein